MQFLYRIEGMHCTACIEKIKSALSTNFIINEITLDPPLLKLEADKPPLMRDLNSSISSAGKYHLYPINHSDHTNSEVGISAYYPIFLLAAYIVGVASINNITNYQINWHGWMYQFMAGFFLVFSAFKFLDIRGFADGYATYDLLARRWHTYGFIYPYLELALGILYLTGWLTVTTLIATIVIMGFSSIGVINSLLKKQKIQCACLGTLLKVPLSSVTLIEDLIMVFMAVLALLMMLGHN